MFARTRAPSEPLGLPGRFEVIRRPPQNVRARVTAPRESMPMPAESAGSEESTAGSGRAMGSREVSLGDLITSLHPKRETGESTANCGPREALDRRRHHLALPKNCERLSTSPGSSFRPTHQSEDRSANRPTRARASSELSTRFAPSSQAPKSRRDLRAEWRRPRGWFHSTLTP